MGFLDLPAELRNAIYELALVNSDAQARDYWRGMRKPREPAFLRVNRQIRNEASIIFWGGNTFRFDESLKTFSWLNRMQPHKIAALRSVQSSSCARVWSVHLVQAKKDLQLLHDSLGRDGLRPDVVKLPVQVESEERDGDAKHEESMVWVSLANIDDFQRSSKPGFVVRKATVR